MGLSKNNQQLSTARRHEEWFFSPPSHGRRRNQIIKCEKQHRNRKKGMDLSARLPSWGYLLRRGASKHASHGGYIARALQWGQWRRRPWQKGRHSPSMLHLANTDGCQGLVSQACPLQVAPRPSEPTLKGPFHCLRGLSSNDMPYSPPKLHRRAPPPSMVGGEVLSQSYCWQKMVEKKMFKMIVSLLGLCVGDLWSESHHNKEIKWRSSFKTVIKI